VEDIPLQTFVLELYIPELDEAAATRVARGLEEAAARLELSGERIAWQRAVALLAEESLLGFFLASDAAQIREAGRLAGIGRADVHEAIALERSPDLAKNL
jgi:hypothetical protein